MPSPLPLPPRETLIRLLNYNPETGEFTWKPRTPDMFNSPNKPRAAKVFNGKYAGKPAQNIHRLGYVRIGILGKRFNAHRIAWKITYNEEPPEIDHINGNPSDNRICNLRAATRTENAQNCAVRHDNGSGYPGVNFAKRDGVYFAQVICKGVRHYLGRFATFEEAKAARIKAETRLGFHANHGRQKANHVAASNSASSAP